MQFSEPLERATLLRRYKRFLADVTLADGREVTVHCPNPGAMTGLAEPGTSVWVEPARDPKRKLQWSWRLTECADGTLVAVDTGLANKVVAEALAEGRIPALAPWPRIRPEARYGTRHRVDFLLGDDGTGATALPDFYLEVKSVTLMRDAGVAEFPDTRTERGARHMAALADMVAAGHRAAVLFLVGRGDCATMRPACDIDPAYARALAAALAAGVELLCHRADITPAGLRLGPALRFAPLSLPETAH